MPRGGFQAGYDVGTFALKFFLLFMLLALLLPPVAIAAGIYLLVTRNRRHGAWLTLAFASFAAAAAIIGYFWYPFYVNERYYESLPISSSNGPATKYADEMRRVGFTNVSVDFDRSEGKHCPSMSGVDDVRVPADAWHNQLVRKDAPVSIHIECW